MKMMVRIVRKARVDHQHHRLDLDDLIFWRGKREGGRVKEE